MRLKFLAQYTKVVTEQRTAGVLCGRTTEDYQMKIRTQDNCRLHRSGRLECGYVTVLLANPDPVIRIGRCC